MGPSLETFARRHAHLDEEAAYRALLMRESVQAWLREDSTRADRLRRAFGAAWQRTHLPNGRDGDGPAPGAPGTPAPTGCDPTRQFLCTHCRRPEVRARTDPQGGVTVLCDHCDRRYDNLLDLVPAEPAGPLTFVFGPGWRAAAIPTTYALALTSLYLALRWLR